MYEQHFGFSSPMFSDGLSQDDAVFLPASYQRLTESLEIAFGRKDAVAVLSGVPGTGKSTLTGHALRSISTGLAFSCISHVPLTAHELLEQLLFDYGFEPYKLSRVERLQTWRQFLFEMSATGTRVCILVEAAETLGTDVLQALHSFTVADATHCPGANLVLTTSQEADTLLCAETLQPLNQRVRLRRRIDALSSGETHEYLDFKAGLAGIAGGDLFAEGTDDAIHDLSRGIIRLIDSLLESSLRCAAIRQESRLTPGLVRAVANDQFAFPGAGGTRIAEPAPDPSPIQGATGSSPDAASSDRPQSRFSVTVPEKTAATAYSPVGVSPQVSAPEAQHVANEGPATTDRESEEREATHVVEEVGDTTHSGDIPTLNDPVLPSDGLADTDLHRVEIDAIATAEKLEDLSRSMAETVFGDRDFDDIVAAMAKQRLA